MKVVIAHIEIFFLFSAVLYSAIVAYKVVYKKYKKYQVLLAHNAKTFDNGLRNMIE